MQKDVSEDSGALFNWHEKPQASRTLAILAVCLRGKGLRSELLPHLGVPKFTIRVKNGPRVLGMGQRECQGDIGPKVRQSVLV